MKNNLFKFAAAFAGFLCLLTAQTRQPNCESAMAPLEDRIEAQRRMLVDWAGLIRYGSENTELPRLKPGEERVVFLGDEITENWDLAKAFPGKSYLNRGIKGQTTPQMLVRFRQDVISLQPKAVVILAGANDIASFTAPITQRMTAENITSIAELAKANNIRVVLASITPIGDWVRKQSAARPVGKILGLNDWLEEYAKQSGAVYVNFYPALVQGRFLKKEFTEDGFLLNDAAYAAITPLAEQAIATALKKSL